MKVIFDDVGFYEIINIFFLKIISIVKNRKIDFYYINNNNSKISFLYNIKKLNWKHKDIIDSKGLNYEILASRELKDNLLLELIENTNFNVFLKSDKDLSHIKNYIVKYLAGNYWPGTNKRTIESIIYTFASINNIFKNNKNEQIIFFIPIFFNFSLFQAYASKWNIVLKKSYRSSLFLSWIKFYLSFFIKTSKIFNKIINLNTKYYNFKDNIKTINNTIIEFPIQNFVEPFFLKNLELNFKNIYFTNFMHKLSELDEIDIKKNKANFIGIYSHIVKNTNLPYLTKSNYHFLCDKFNFKKTIFFNYDYFHLIKIIQAFHFEYKISYEFFKKTKSKIYLTNYITNQHIIPASLAIRDLGGISLSTRNSFCDEITIPLSIHTDIYLSMNNKNIERKDNIISSYKYNFPVGYYGDYKFNYLAPKAYTLRKKLFSKGAKFIISFFDQGYYADNRYSYGYDNSAKNYEFLLDKLISNKSMGLLLKPKKPGHIYKKLGNKINLLEKAIETGRCEIELGSEGGTPKFFRRPPAYFAMASDLAIAEALISATAGVESYLAGTKTIFLDFFGYKNSIFLNDKLDQKLVYSSLSDLWKLIEQNFVNNNKLEIGNWGEIKNEIDKFNDKKSDYRISRIINELFSNFNMNMDRDTNLLEIKKFYDLTIK